MAPRFSFEVSTLAIALLPLGLAFAACNSDNSSGVGGPATEDASSGSCVNAVCTVGQLCIEGQYCQPELSCAAASLVSYCAGGDACPMTWTAAQAACPSGAAGCALESFPCSAATYLVRCASASACTVLVYSQSTGALTGAYEEVPRVHCLAGSFSISAGCALQAEVLDAGLAGD
jgi:hypothetical protein